LNQLIIAFTLLVCGTGTYYYIPLVVLHKLLDTFTFYVNILLLLTIIGLIMVSQALIPSLERFILSVIVFFRPNDKRLKPIVNQNLESHGKRNMKTSLMFTVTVSFLVLSAANLQQIQFFLVAITKSFTGADLIVSRRFQGGPSGGPVTTALDEYRISEFLQENLVSKGGIV